MIGANKVSQGDGGSAPPTSPVGSFWVQGRSANNYNTPTWVVPPGVYSISVCGIGAGGGGGYSSTTSSRGSGGGGGALAWSNDIAVTPGETLNIYTDPGGAPGNSSGIAGGNGGDTYITRGGTTLFRAKGGLGGGGNSSTAGRTGGQASACVYTGGAYSGGDGGAATNLRTGGGGGTGGYAGAGGAGGGSITTTGAAGGGDGAGGGGSAYSTNSALVTPFCGGGASLSGTGGTTGTEVTPNAFGVPGGRFGSSTLISQDSNGWFGAGGGGGCVGNGGRGGPGAIRIIHGSGRSWPSSAAMPSSLTLVYSNIATTGNITLPGAGNGVQVGDTMILITGSSGNVQPTTPSGWNILNWALGGTYGNIGYYSKRVEASDLGATLSGFSASVNSSFLCVFRTNLAGGGGLSLPTHYQLGTLDVLSSTSISTPYNVNPMPGNQYLWGPQILLVAKWTDKSASTPTASALTSSVTPTPTKSTYISSNANLLVHLYYGVAQSSTITAATLSGTDNGRQVYNAQFIGFV